MYMFKTTFFKNVTDAFDAKDENGNTVVVIN